MDNNYRIKEGDKVNVFFESVGCEIDVEVLYTPCATGDCWHLKRYDGKIVYVQSFAKMELCTAWKTGA